MVLAQAFPPSWSYALIAHNHEVKKKLSVQGLWLKNTKYLSICKPTQVALSSPYRWEDWPRDSASIYSETTHQDTETKTLSNQILTHQYPANTHKKPYLFNHSHLKKTHTKKINPPGTTYSLTRGEGRHITLAHTLPKGLTNNMLGAGGGAHTPKGEEQSDFVFKLATDFTS